MNWSNVCGATRAGLLAMKRLSWSAIPTDKDGGFACIKDEVLPLVFEETLADPMYQEVHPLTIAYQRIRQWYTGVAFQIGKLEQDKRVAGYLTKSLEGNIASPLGLLCCILW